MTDKSAIVTARVGSEMKSEARIPKARDEMTQEEFDIMIQTGLEQARNGESIPAVNAFDLLLGNIA